MNSPVRAAAQNIDCTTMPAPSVRPFTTEVERQNIHVNEEYGQDID
jgi:hypothetical protein